MTYPLVTVYITNYNYGHFIDQAIKSVLNQSLADFELIIIDDGSTDKSREIIEKYSNQGGINIIYQQNKGLNVTNNIAMRAAHGKYLMRLDADDYLAPSALEKMTAELESDEALGLVFPNYYYVDKDGEIIGEEKRHDFQNDVELLDQPAHGACTMIRLDFLKQVGGYNESYNCQDGYELWLKFTRHFKVSNISQNLFFYRQHGSNLTGDENKILSTRARINEDFVNEQSYDKTAIAIIPVRGGATDIAFSSLSGVNLLELKVKKVCQSKNIKRIIITSPDLGVKDLVDTLSSGDIIKFHHRKKSEARFNQNLNPTIEEIVKEESRSGLDFRVITLITVEYPFLDVYKIDDAINTMLVFGSDSIIGVRTDNSVFYQHHGDGLHPILNRDKYTKLEREALFKQVGGITSVMKDVFIEKKEMITGNVGHVMMDQLSSLGLFTKVDWQIAESLIKTKLIKLL
ncbi:MAG: glycosyltransferase [Cyclobacteriaceae bacterium]